MKSLFALIALVLVVGSNSFAAGPKYAEASRTVFDCCAVTSSAYTTIKASTIRRLDGIMVANSGTVGLKIAVGASGAEVDQLNIPASQSTPVYYPIKVSAIAQRISMKALGSTGSTGEANINLIYEK